MRIFRMLSTGLSTVEAHPYLPRGDVMKTTEEKPEQYRWWVQWALMVSLVG